ncbi:MAG TPA: hypothetical protein VFT74_08235 [Isosphaeraceae bacterium]|nr:hypothetical protein [Isosphaeraceae bacterium]
MRSTWHRSLAEHVPMFLMRLGFRQGELRLYFESLVGNEPNRVLQLEEIAAYHDSLVRGPEVRISDRSNHGSFGWWLPPEEPHHSIKIVAVGCSGFFLGLARRVIYRIPDEDEARNWPG